MKTRIRLLTAILAVSLLTGCGGSSKNAYDATAPEMKVMEEAAAEEYYYDDMADTATETGTTNGSIGTNGEIASAPQVNRKLIRTFDLDIQTKEFDEVIAGIQAKVQELGGYIEQSSIDSGSAYYSNYNRYSNMTLRIPSDKLDGFIQNVKDTANVTNISESAEDITLKYVDVESRKLALETERDRLLELLEKAETVEDIITIESRLSEVRYELEAYTSTLRTYDNQVDYSNVHMNIREVDRETKVEPKTFWEEVTEEFGDSLYDMGRGFRNFGIWFLGSSPYLVLWALIIAVVVFVLRVFGKKKKLRKILKNQPTEFIPEETVEKEK